VPTGALAPYALTDKVIAIIRRAETLRLPPVES